MATTKTFRNEQLIPLLNNLAALLRWLRPGTMALKVARIKSALEAPAIAYQTVAQSLIDELVIFDDVGEGEAKRKVRRRRPHDANPGVEIWDFGSRHAEFTKRDKELSVATVEITFGAILTLKDVEKIETKERIERLPRDKDGNPMQIEPVDFSALLPIIEDEEAPPTKTKEEPKADVETRD